MDLLDKTSVVYDKMSFCCERFENYMLSSERNEEDLKRILTTMQEMKEDISRFYDPQLINSGRQVVNQIYNLALKRCVYDSLHRKWRHSQEWIDILEQEVFLIVRMNNQYELKDALIDVSIVITDSKYEVNTGDLRLSFSDLSNRHNPARERLDDFITKTLMGVKAADLDKGYIVDFPEPYALTGQDSNFTKKSFYIIGIIIEDLEWEP